jgi:hypothetical protein
LVKKDIFKNLMWYTLPDSNKQYPLSIERVNKIKELNQQNIRPDELEPVDITSKTAEKEPEFVELVGQISLKSLDKAAEQKRRQNQQGNQQRGQRPQQGGNQQRPNNPNRNQGNQQRPPRNQQGGNQQRNQQGGNQQRPNNPNRNQGNQQKPNNPNQGQDKKE